jgi:hypothetical protein
MIDSLFTKQRQNIDYDKFEARYSRFQNQITWVFSIFNGPTGMNNTPVRAALAFAHPTAPKKIEQFAKQVRDGEGLQAGDPAQTLRHYFLETQTVEKDDPRIRAVKVLTAAEAFLDGEPVTRLFAKQESVDFFAQQYPDLKQQSPLQTFEFVRAQHNPAPPTPEHEKIVVEFTRRKRVSNTVERRPVQQIEIIAPGGTVVAGPGRRQ